MASEACYGRLDGDDYTIRARIFVYARGGQISRFILRVSRVAGRGLRGIFRDIEIVARAAKFRGSHDTKFGRV